MDKSWEPQKIRNRHLAIMEAMVTQPTLSQGQLAAQLGYSQSRLSIIINSPLFQYAFEAYRRKHMEKISDVVADATVAAVKFNKRVIENENVEIPIKQVSARDILGLGHAKAVERSANLNVSTQVPADLLESLRPLLEEVKQPFAPTRHFMKPPEKEGEDSGD